MDELDKIIRNLSSDEKKVLQYFIKNLSVGEILAIKEIRLLLNIDKPERVIDSLILKGLLEKAPGCFNLSRRVREILKKGSKELASLT